VLAGSVIVVLPAVGIFLAMRRYVVRGLWQGNLKG
jgi:ABC-type glycerol-3-phosphate transport system permease component